MDDMILEAGKLASGKSSPIAYMNGILSNWKNNNVFTIENLPSKDSASDNSQEAYNRERLELVCNNVDLFKLHIPLSSHE